jgi:hypothetical protein
VDGLINAFAGTGFWPFTTTYPYSAPANYVVDDGPAPATTLNLKACNGLYVLPNGVVYVYDNGNHRIRRVGLDGIMSTVVNDPDPLWLPSGRGLWVSPQEDLIYYTQEVADMSLSQPTTSLNRPAMGGVVKKWTPTGGIKAITRYPSSPTRATLELTNPGNIDVNPITGKLYVTDRAEDLPANSCVWRINTESVNPLTTNSNKTRVAGIGAAAASTPDSADTVGLLAKDATLNQVRGISFTPNGGYFLCTHRGGKIWYVDSTADYTQAQIHLFMLGRGKNEVSYVANPPQAMPILNIECHSQPRAVTVGPDGSVYVVSNDSGLVRKVKYHVVAAPPKLDQILTPQSNLFEFTWKSTKGHSYVVERSTNQLPASWQVAGVVTAISTTAAYMDDSLMVGPRNFYRLTEPR